MAGSHVFKKKCTGCGGSGKVSTSTSKKCGSCNGTGKVNSINTVTCGSCRGTGRVSSQVQCSHTGYARKIPLLLFNSPKIIIIKYTHIKQKRVPILGHPLLIQNMVVEGFIGLQ